MTKRILLIYANEYFLTSPVYPFGLDIMASFLESQGHVVEIGLPFLVHGDPARGLTTMVQEFGPDILGIGIRNIDTAMACDPCGTLQEHGISTHFFLPKIARMVEALKKQCPKIPVVIGGTGFSISPDTVLEYVGADFGITGSGARPMALFTENWPDLEKIRQIPNLIFPGCKDPLKKKNSQILI
ncbi:B12-binding domain-containing radical SAM protei n? [Desulfonema ishimotonii]|uniref:B12-binding domain-containing radical SAM protei n n=1 Tax=Desulfonema ishimotonii TaxID=45657 RepID=A0A401G4L9_9BACT|nr:cobalamin B12-binding domain-containing protein [Desulfonema ishimotonii]GBC64166.1 B12-binding domain-containing radical SAM protei n? [Desulfonema ishimotonii]